MPTAILATCAALPDGDEDATLLLAALERAGVRARWQIWTDPAVDWTAALTVVRSTWDYTERPEQFRRWLRSVPRLENPADVIEWSSDKTYLADLVAAGVPIVPTAFARPGQRPTLPPGVEFVVKPSVGAGSRGAGRFAPDDLDGGLAQVEMLHAAGRTALVQPYQHEVDTRGETALLYFDGEFSHAVSKGAMLPEGTAHPMSGYSLYVEERIAPRTASDAELAVGAKAIGYLRERFGRDLLYTRVDLLPGADGPVLVELEVAEPSAFLRHSASVAGVGVAGAGVAGVGAADRFAAAIAARV